MTAVEAFWTGHTVSAGRFASPAHSLAYLEQRSAMYPLFHDLMGLWGRHDDEVILDYGCGPANDMVGFLAHTKARKVIGMDVSPTAFAFALERLELHGFDSARWELVQVSDAVPGIPLPDASVDFVYCEGVLHHVSHPEAVLAEIHRVLRPGGKASIMVYNRDSLWFHRWVAYDRQIRDGTDAGLSLDEAFRRSTDGEGCPISRAYRPTDFVNLCRTVGFDVAFLGGYFSHLELTLDRGVPSDVRLAQEHCAFLAALTSGPVGPLYNGLPAGIGGTYSLIR